MKATQQTADRKKLLVLSILLPVAVVLALWWITKPAFLEPGAEFSSFATDYHSQVDDLLSGRGFTSFRYPPMFPLLLAGIEWFAKTTGLASGTVGGCFLLFQAALGGVLVFLLAELLFDVRRAFVAVAALTFYPLFLRLSLQPLSASPFILLLLVTTLLFLHQVCRDRLQPLAFVLIGTCLGIAMLVRPIGIGLGLVFAGLTVVLLSKQALPRRCLGAALLLVAQTLVLVPWEVVAYQHEGHVIPLSSGGVASILDGLTYAVDPSEARPVVVPRSVRKLQEKIYAQSYRELDSTGAVVAFFMDELRRDPVPVVLLMTIKAARALYGTDAGVLDRWLLLGQLFLLPVLAYAVWLALKAGGLTRSYGLVVCTLVVYFWGMTVLTLSIVRYMAPALACAVVALPTLLPERLRTD